MATIQQPTAVLKPYQAAEVQKRTFILGPLLLFTLDEMVGAVKNPVTRFQVKSR